MIMAIDVLKWPGMNEQFIVAFVGTLVLSLVVIPYGKRHPPGRPILKRDSSSHDSPPISSAHVSPSALTAGIVMSG